MKIYKALKSYLDFNFCIYFILVLCFLGVFRNTIFLTRYHALGQNIDDVFIAMIAIYAAQILLILLKQWAVWIISLIQVGFCIYVYPDFSILPFSAVIKYIFFTGISESSYTWAKFISFMLVSFGFSVEILKTYLLYIYFPKKTYFANNKF